MRRLVIFTIVAGFISASIPACSPVNQEIELFNGRDLSGWEYFLVDEDAGQKHTLENHDIVQAQALFVFAQA